MKTHFFCIFFKSLYIFFCIFFADQVKKQPSKNRQFGCQEREDLAGLRALRSDRAVATPSSNRARIGDSLEHLLSGAQARENDVEVVNGITRELSGNCHVRESSLVIDPEEWTSMRRLDTFLHPKSLQQNVFRF